MLVNLYYTIKLLTAHLNENTIAQQTDRIVFTRIIPSVKQTFHIKQVLEFNSLHKGKPNS